MCESFSPCAKGTSQIAHRISLSVRMLSSYVRFGTSLLHITKHEHRVPFACDALLCHGLRLRLQPCRGPSGPPFSKAGFSALSRAAPLFQTHWFPPWVEGLVQFAPASQPCAKAVPHVQKLSPCAKWSPHVQKGRPKSHIGSAFQCACSHPMCNLERPFCTWGERVDSLGIPRLRAFRTVAESYIIRHQIIG